MADSRIESQMIFNEVVAHLAQQQRRAANEGGGNMCSYRTWEGLSCAVGCLLTDEEYRVTFEGKPVSRLVLDKIFPERLLPHANLLMELQRAHDNSESLRALQLNLTLVAFGFDLNPELISSIEKWTY